MNTPGPLRCRGAQGFSLLEALVSTTILIVGVGALAQLFLVSAHANRAAREATFASILARAKMEQLRGLAWGFDNLGWAVTGTTTDTTVVPESPTGGTGLAPSPSGSLARNAVGYCDYLDGAGRPLGGGAVPPAAAVFIRRWSVEPLPTNSGNAVVLQVVVTTRRDHGTADPDTTVRRLPEEARLVSVRTRKAR